MEAEWFIGRDGQTFGPFSFDQLVASAKDGSLSKDDFAWRPGMAEWGIAGSIPGVWLPPALPVPIKANTASVPNLGEHSVSPGSGSAHAPDPAPTSSGLPDAPSQTNFIARHWRGELSLAKSYWLVGALLTFVVIIVAALVGEILGSADLTPTAAGVWLTAFLVAICALTIWQLVGIWRSAGNHIKSTGRSGWAIAARVMVVFGAVKALTDFSSLVGPMLSASVQLAAGIDNTPPHEIRLMRDGKEIELSGGMPFGTADSLRKFLDAAPTVKIVHLNSVGGLLSEGYQLQKLFRDRQIATYTAVDCVSACTMAFLGGEQRYLSEKGRLGFHSANFGGLDQNELPDVNREMRAVLVAHGAPSQFIDKAITTDAASMWYPSHEELIAANIVTAIVDPSNFAMSGIPGWRDDSLLERSLAQIPYMRALKQNNATAYKKLSKRYVDAVRAGRSQLELTAAVHSVFTTEILPGYMAIAPDLALIRYWRSQIGELKHLAGTNADLCLEFMNITPRRQLDSLKQFPAHLLDEDMASLANLIEATHAAPAPQATDQEALQEDTLAVFANLEKSMPGASVIAIEPHKHMDKPLLVCGSIVAFYDAVLALPPERAGRFLRSVAAENK